jgi:hypothetical protein
MKLRRNLDKKRWCKLQRVIGNAREGLARAKSEWEGQLAVVAVMAAAARLAHTRRKCGEVHARAGTSLRLL